MSPAVKRNNMLIKRNKILACLTTHKTVKEIAQATNYTYSYINKAVLEMYFDNKVEIIKPESRQRKDPYVYIACGTPYKLVFDKPVEYDYPKLRPLYFVQAVPSKKGIVKVEDNEEYAKHCKESQRIRNKQPVKQEAWVCSSAAML